MVGSKSGALGKKQNLKARQNEKQERENHTGQNSKWPQELARPCPSFHTLFARSFGQETANLGHLGFEKGLD